MMKKINVTQSSMPVFEEYIKEIQDLWDSKWLTNNGEKHQLLEQKLIDYLGVPNITLYTNGHLALENIIAAYNLKGEVITTPFTFASTTHAIVRNGLTPVFCDIDPTTYTIDADKIESLITERTTAIIPVHVYGNACDVEKICQVAEKYNLKVIYDAAHVFGMKIKGQGVANFGDASMFSFHATKVFNTIEGGAITYKDSNLTKKLNELKNFGISGIDEVSYIAGNAKMNEFQAAMGLCNLKHIDQEIFKRKKVVERYIEQLKGIEGIQLNLPQEGVESNYAYFPIVFNNYKKSRDDVYEELTRHQIIARKYFYPLITDFDCYKNQYDSNLTPIAKKIAAQVLTLPLYADLSLEDVDRICEIIKK
jgi:dTDP-4-amino-4,6-dideoxygalactose transaminase